MHVIQHKINLFYIKHKGRNLPSSPSSSHTAEQSSSIVSVDIGSDAENTPVPTPQKDMKKSLDIKSKRNKTNNDQTFIPNVVLKRMNSQRVYSNGEERPETDVPASMQNTLGVKELTLYDCLENEYGFHAFLCHAYKEFSIENVLAVVELQQFQDYYQGKKRDKRSSIRSMRNNWKRSHGDDENKKKINRKTRDCVMNSDHIEMVTIPRQSTPITPTPTTPIESGPMELKNVSSESVSKSKRGEYTQHIPDFSGAVNMFDNDENKHESQDVLVTNDNKSNLKPINKTRKLGRMTSIDELLNNDCGLIQNHSFNLPKLPNSSIVYDNTLSMREKIMQLLDKYIESGGEFELNLGSSQRSELLKKKEMLSSIDDDECSAMFNTTIYSIIALMHDSFIRFQQTNSYEQLRKDLFGKSYYKSLNKKDNKTETLL